MLKTKGFIEPKGSKRDFKGGFFLGKTKGFIEPKALRLNVHTFITGQTEGFKVGCGGMGLRWLSRFKLIRLWRISLATLPRYGWRDGY